MRFLRNYAIFVCLNDNMVSMFAVILHNVYDILIRSDEY